MNSKKHLCIIDDDKIYQFTIKKTLELKQNFGRLSCFDDGLAAINYIKDNLDNQTEIPDIILLDIKMPRMNGWDFLEEFLTIKPLIKKELDLFLVTSSIDYRDRERALDYSEISKFRVKPISYKEMEHILMEVA
ncbi:response regulator [Owenweeksia hongkongensis]|uniref:response regulator n=1 Tax=Owenweeksia hongkongensis TaxID=253245 RepID=UPI003A8F2770